MNKYKLVDIPAPVYKYQGLDALAGKHFAYPQRIIILTLSGADTFPYNQFDDKVIKNDFESGMCKKNMLLILPAG
jgi:hypothetical protein